VRTLGLALTGRAIALSARHRLLGNRADLDQAVECAESAVADGEASGSTRFASYRASLSEILGYRFDAYGSIDDLERAIELREANVRDQPPADAVGERAMLGTLLRRRWSIERRTEDLQRAVELLESVIDVPAGRDRPARLTNLGNALLNRYDAMGDVEDLRRAAELQEQAVELTQPGDWQLASRHNNAGNSAMGVYRLTDDDTARGLAIDHYRASIALTDVAAPELSSRQYNLARALMPAAEDSPHVIEETQEAFRAGCVAGLEGSLQWALGSSREWGDWALSREAWDEAAEAYGFGEEAISELFRRQLDRDEKEAWLRVAQGLPARAAYALARAGRPQEASTSLERGRAFLLSEALERDRADLAILEAAGHEELADRYRAASDELRRASGAPGRRAARAQLDAVIDAIQGMPSFADFLRPPQFDDISDAAAEAPVVYLAATHEGGVALVVSGQPCVPHAVRLDGLSERALQARAGALFAAHDARRQSRATWASTIDAIAAWLWPVVMGPVLEALGGAETAVLVPAGVLGFMPLHAAWTPAPGTPTGRRYAVDAMSLSYAPNARSVLAARRATVGPRPDSVLGVEDPRPTSAGPVPCAGVEVSTVITHFGAADVLRAEGATRTSVLAKLVGSGVFHCACHGIASPEAPLDSALIMAADEPLTLRDLLEVRPSDAQAGGTRLAVLSACEASRPGDDLPDEMIGLPAGMLQAGLAGVIASQWAVDGAATAMLMARFYERWRVGGLEVAAALRDAQRWLRDTTCGEKADWFAERADAGGDEALRTLWRASVRKPSTERTYAHPRYWAAFSHVGA
jgi:CHAT domain-containing protein